MSDTSFFFTLVSVCLIGGMALGVGCERMRSPPTYSDQWESVYVTCSRAGGDTEARRSECIAAADRVMKCSGEVKP